MNKGMLSVGIILLGLIALLLISVLTNYSTGSELDYYLVKETTDAAMEDSIDLLFYRNCGLYRIDKEKFVESFLYRFSDSVDNTREYKLAFYDINEVPPKVSVKVDSLTVLSFNAPEGMKDKDGNDVGGKQAADITTSYDAILETDYKADLATEAELSTNLINTNTCKKYLGIIKENEGE